MGFENNGPVKRNDGAFLYIIGYGNMMKVGVSNDPHARLATMQTGAPETLNIYYLCAIHSRERAFRAERAVHSSLAHRKMRGEWFLIDSEDAVDAASAVIRRHARHGRHTGPVLTFANIDELAQYYARPRCSP